MKKKLSGVLVLISAAILIMLLPGNAHASYFVEINSTNFPDQYFRAYISERFDDNEDGCLDYDEVEYGDAIFLDADDGPIKSLKGIELLPELTTLGLDEMDISSIDLSSLEQLKELYITNSAVKNLVVGIPGLRKLECSGNNLTKLNVDACTKLQTLDCSDNSLTSLDLSKCTKLEELECQKNKLTTLKLPASSYLELLDCSDNKLAALDVSKNKNLLYLYCGNNLLTELDNSQNTKLKTLSCPGNRLIALYVTTNPNLLSVNCSGNQLPGLDLSKNASLRMLYIDGNPGKKYNITGTALGAALRKGLGKTILEGGAGVDIDTPTPGRIGYWEWESDDLEDEGDVGGGWYELKASFDEDDVAVALDTPTINTANTGTGIKVSWNKVAGAAQCEVWRAPKGSTNYKLLKTADGTSYTDKTAKAGESYSYRICAKNSVIYSKNAAKSIIRNPFTDVSETASYFNAVIWAVQNGITSGTSSTTFSPNADCTRYQFAVMLYKLAGKPAVSGTLPFKDVKKTDSYYNAVLWAYMNGIISGTSSTTFSPNDGITRYQVVAMLYKFVGKPPVSGTLPFKDVSTKASYYNAVLWAVQNNITKGTDSTHFSPNAVCKRYQLVVFLYKFNNIYHIK